MDFENTQDTQDTQDTQTIQTIQDTQDSQATQDPQDPQGPQVAQNVLLVETEPKIVPGDDPEPATRPDGEAFTDAGQSDPPAAAGAPPLTVVNKAQIPVQVTTAADIGVDVELPRPAPTVPEPKDS